VHTYTSPHLEKFRERISLNNKTINANKLLKCLEKVKKINNKKILKEGTKVNIPIAMKLQKEGLKNIFASLEEVHGRYFADDIFDTAFSAISKNHFESLSALVISPNW